MVDRDRGELARDRRRPPTAPGEVRDVERHGFRLGRESHAADPGGEGAEIAPVGGVGALAGWRAAGLGGRPSVGAQLVDRRDGVGGEHAKRHFFFIVEWFGRDRHAVGGFATGLILTSEK